MSSESDKYDTFRLVHQLVYGGCDSIERLENVIDVSLDLLSRVYISLVLGTRKLIYKTLSTLITFCNLDKMSTILDLQMSVISPVFWVPILLTRSSVTTIRHRESEIVSEHWVGIL